MVFATLAFLGAFGADQGLLTYFADLSGPAWRYTLRGGVRSLYILILYIIRGRREGQEQLLTVRAFVIFF